MGQCKDLKFFFAGQGTHQYFWIWGVGSLRKQRRGTPKEKHCSEWVPSSLWCSNLQLRAQWAQIQEGVKEHRTGLPLRSGRHSLSLLFLKRASCAQVQTRIGTIRENHTGNHRETGLGQDSDQKNIRETQNAHTGNPKMPIRESQKPRTKSFGSRRGVRSGSVRVCTGKRRHWSFLGQFWSRLLW